MCPSRSPGGSPSAARAGIRACRERRSSPAVRDQTRRGPSDRSAARGAFRNTFSSPCETRRGREAISSSWDAPCGSGTRADALADQARFPAFTGRAFEAEGAGRCLLDNADLYEDSTIARS
jgi:hypothetical protein